MGCDGIFIEENLLHLQLPQNRVGSFRYSSPSELLNPLRLLVGPQLTSFNNLRPASAI